MAPGQEVEANCPRPTPGQPGMPEAASCEKIRACLPSPSHPSEGGNCNLPASTWFLFTKVSGHVSHSCLEKEVITLATTAAFSDLVQFHPMTGEELPCEGDTPFSKHLCWFLFIMLNQVPWTPSTVSSKRKNLSLKLCPRKISISETKETKEGC